MIVIILTLLIVEIILAVIFRFNIKKLKSLGENKKLDEVTKKYPDNIEICKKILKILKNEDVKIEEDKNADTCLYIAITNKIIIANMKDKFVRIQTIAHECLHSIQDKIILKFNFIFSNIYLLFFVISIILGIIKKVPNEYVFLNIFILCGLVYYVVRAYLENDAMIKARYVAKEYMEQESISSKEEIEEIIHEYDKINNVGIKCANFSLVSGVIIKALIIAVIYQVW